MSRTSKRAEILADRYAEDGSGIEIHCVAMGDGLIFYCLVTEGTHNKIAGLIREFHNEVWKDKCQLELGRSDDGFVGVIIYRSPSIAEALSDYTCLEKHRVGGLLDHLSLDCDFQIEYSDDRQNDCHLIDHVVGLSW